jgi:GNAT superfamily N-acetyltransferase
MLRDVVRSEDVEPYEVRPARPGEESAVRDVCCAGFAASSRGLLPPAATERRIREYYDLARVRSELAPAGDDPRWQGYVVAATASGRVIGAAGGGVTDRTVGHVLVLYLDLALRGQGIGTALLDAVTRQQVAAGATEQRVSVTEGNELAIPFYLARGFVVRDRVPFEVAADGTVEAFSLSMSRAV